jgi:hypothetical protein
MLHAIPKYWFSWDFNLCGAMGEAIAEICLSSWRERGSVVLSGTEYRIHRQGLAGSFLLEEPDSTTAASAVKTSVLYREFTIHQGTQKYTLKSISAFGREFGLFKGEERIGSIQPESWWGRRAKVEFADEVHPLIQAFAVWLTLLLWKRDASESASAGGS